MVREEHDRRCVSFIRAAESRLGRAAGAPHGGRAAQLYPAADATGKPTLINNQPINNQPASLSSVITRAS